MFVGFSSDTFIVAYSTPQVASNLRNHLVISTGTAPIVTLGQMAVASIKWPDGTVQVSSGSGGGGGGGTPAGNNGNLQYNNAGAFGGIATSTFTPSTNSLVIGATTTILGTTANFSGNVTMTISSGSQLITSTGSFSNFQGSVTMRTVSISSNVYVLNKSSIVFVDPNLKTVRFYLDQTTDSYSVKLPGANPSVDDYLKITACTGFNCTASWAPSAAAGFTAGTLVRSNFATSNTPASTTNNTWFDTGICATDSQLGGVGSVNRITAVGNLTTSDIGVSGAFATILLARLVVRLNLAFLVLDAIGLVVFTMAGCDVAWQVDASLPIVIVSGMITGCAGGVLRDILCNEVPLLFRSELYASVSVVTGLFYATAFGLNLNPPVWTLLTFVLGLSFRMLAIRYKWEMPKFVFSGEER